MAPCSLPSSFGWNFIVILAVCSTVYVGGGIAYNHKVKGETLAYENARQLLPHMEYWQALGGLVSDGMSFSKTSWDACVCPSQSNCRPALCCDADVTVLYEVVTQPQPMTVSTKRHQETAG